MTFGQKLAYHIAPIFVRLVLGVTFLWVGLGKLIPEDYEITPENAQALVDMGAVEQPKVQGFLDAAPPDDATSDESAPDDDGATDPPDDQPPDDQPAEGDPGEGGGDDPGGGGSALAPSHAIMLAQNADDDLPKLKPLFGVAVLVSQASKTTTTEDGKTHKALLPAFMGDGATPKYLGWAVAIAEVFAGGFLLIGFLARVSGLAVIGIMGMAMWLTEIGPAVMGHVDAELGFLPAPPDGNIFDVGAYMGLAWQLILLAGGLTIFFSGAGTLSLDRILFGSSKSDDFDED